MDSVFRHFLRKIAGKGCVNEVSDLRIFTCVREPSTAAFRQFVDDKITVSYSMLYAAYPFKLKLIVYPLRPTKGSL